MRRWSAIPLLAALLAVSFGFGCQEAPVRPQAQFFIDVDMPVPAQIGSAVGTDAVVDTIRVEVLGADLSLLDSRTFSLTSLESLPLSFGIPSDIVADGHVLVRMRAFRAFFAAPGEQDGLPVLDPLADITVDRLVDVSLPTEGVVPVSVTLHGDCMGSKVRFPVGDLQGGTCLDRDHLDAAVTDGIGGEPPSTSVAGSWKLAAVKPCEGEAPPGSTCIPGGMMILGDAQFPAVNEYDIASVPLRVLTLDPFYLDQTEVTVGELRGLIGLSAYDGPEPFAPDPADPLKQTCTWDFASQDGLPINCIEVAVADEVCAARGGTVPTEAQWEFAARGRGARFLYPWGAAPVECCSASIGRVDFANCTDVVGIEPVGSHPGSADCLGDVSLDGVFDLEGSVSELVRDSIASFSDPCWQPPDDGPAILDNPVCIAAVGRMARGAAWGLAFGDAPLPIRRTFLEDDPNYGFRCVYPGAP